MPRHTDLPFDGKTQKFIAFYVDREDFSAAAKFAHISVAEARRCYRTPEVRTEIDRRLDLIHREQARLTAKARKVEVLYLDDQLVRAVKVGSSKGDTKALELGYERVGLRRDGNFMTAAQSSDQSRPEIYRALERTTVTHTQRQITERSVVAEVLSIDQRQTPQLPASVEILDY